MAAVPLLCDPDVPGSCKRVAELVCRSSRRRHAARTDGRRVERRRLAGDRPVERGRQKDSRAGVVRVEVALTRRRVAVLRDALCAQAVGLGLQRVHARRQVLHLLLERLHASRNAGARRRSRARSELDRNGRQQDDQAACKELVHRDPHSWPGPGQRPPGRGSSSGVSHWQGIVPRVSSEILTADRIRQTPARACDCDRWGAEARARRAPFGGGRLMAATVVVGAQWGDEGKGKNVDLLAQDSDLVCRYNGGPNAGHTIVVDRETYKLKHIPSGILQGKECVIGAGCVVDPQVLIEELDDLESRGVSTEFVRLSGNAHVVMPWHQAIDRGSERRLGRLKIGTTRRGIGPTYADKAYRLGIRVQDLLDEKILRQKIEVALAEKAVWMERVYGSEPIELEGLVERYESYAERLRPMIADTSLLVDRALRDGKRVLFDGAHGTLLDLDHGTYPFVTSSPTVAGGAAVGTGIGPTRIDSVIGVAKSYVTRVGQGPFPSEIVGPDQERLRELGGEYGTVTGRERRCGWLDLVALRYAVRLNGMTSLALTKLDVLSDFAEVPVCVRYRLRDGSETDEFPAHQTDFHHAQPVYETLPGWEEPLDGELPGAARAYVEFVERELDLEISLVGIGAERERVLAR